MFSHFLWYKMETAGTRDDRIRAAKHEAVLARLRSTIVAGPAAPGSRLPTCRELSQRLSVSAMTVQRALDQLAEEGFIQTRGTRGTFVVERPPHLFRYGIVFTSDPTGGESGYWPPAWNAFDLEARRVGLVDRRRRIVPYYNIVGHTDVEEYQTLLRDVRAHKLAGLMFTGLTPSLVESPVFEDPELPRVIIGGDPIPGKAAALDVGGVDLFERALDHLKAKRRRRIAAMDVPGMHWLSPDIAIPAARRRGLRIEPYWLLAINHFTPQTADTTVQLLMSVPKRQRPDGLIVANPFLVESATAGLVAAGVRVPQDIEVIAGGNFPHLTRAHVPVTWLGCDIREMVRDAIVLIDRKRRGEVIPERVRPRNLFESELSPTDPLLQLAEV